MSRRALPQWWIKIKDFVADMYAVANDITQPIQRGWSAILAFDHLTATGVFMVLLGLAIVAEPGAGTAGWLADVTGISNFSQAYGMSLSVIGLVVILSVRYRPKAAARLVMYFVTYLIATTLAAIETAAVPIAPVVVYSYTLYLIAKVMRHEQPHHPDTS